MTCRVPSVPRGVIRRFARLCLACVILTTCTLAIARAMVVESFEIPTGSMAPSVRGQHRVCACPNCGEHAVVGRHREERENAANAKLYRNAFCQNCGFYPLPVTDAPVVTGDQVVVNKAAFMMRAPARWEIVVFRFLNAFYIKRLLGLPGEEIRIKDGDLHVNGRLCRKTLAQARHMRVPLQTGLAGSTGRANEVLRCEKSTPFRDEYAYNAGAHAGSELVHDFLVEMDIEVAPNHGTLSLRLCDGHDSVEVVLATGENANVSAFTWPTARPDARRHVATSEKAIELRPGRKHHVECAFVDRRLSFALDGRAVLAVDLPEVAVRGGVTCPFEMRQDGVSVTVHAFRLYRDVHYGQQGKNAVRGKSVRLGVDQYFFLGDNSPHSQDSRFWPDDGAVSRDALIGPVTHTRRATR